MYRYLDVHAGSEMNIDGVHVPAVTPFDDRGDVNEVVFRQVIEHLVNAGVRGIVVAGTTGEYYALSEAERKRLFALAKEAVSGRALLLAGANAGSTAEVIRYGLHARELDYDGLMLACPPTSLPTQDELVAHFSAVAAAVELPIVLYNYPARAGVEIGLGAVERLCGVPQIVGLKESSGDFSRFLALERLFGDRIQISCGSDDQALDYFRWGVTSWIAGTANVFPREHVAVLEAVTSGQHDRAGELMAGLLPWIQHMEAGSYNQKAKLGLVLQGVPVGNTRPPLLPLGDADVAEYTRIFEAARATTAECRT